MEVWRRTDTEREGEEEEGGVKANGLRSQFATSKGSVRTSKRDDLRCQIGISEELEVADCDFKRNKEKGYLRSQIVTSEEAQLEITKCDFKIKSKVQTKGA